MQKSKRCGSWLSRFCIDSEAIPILKVTKLPYLTLCSKKKFQTDTRFRKEKGRHDKNIKRFASGNVIIVNATSLLFDVIDRLCPKKPVKNQNLVVPTDSP